MKIVWKPFEDARLILGFDFRMNKNNTKFKIMTHPVFLTDNGTPVIMKTYKFNDTDELQHFINNSNFTTFYYYYHEYYNVMEQSGNIKTYLKVRFYGE
jgi:uncharacterized membrane protein YkgB